MGGGNVGIPFLNFGLVNWILLFVKDLGAVLLEVPRLMTMAAAKGCIFVIQRLSPVKIPNLEVDPIRQPFADVYFYTDSAVGEESIVPSRVICSEEAS